MSLNDLLAKMNANAPKKAKKIVTTSSSEPSKKDSSSKKEKNQKPQHSGSVMICPDQEKIGWEKFFSELRSAGVRDVEVTDKDGNIHIFKRYVSDFMRTADEKAAVYKYMGFYDNSKELGTQLDNARSIASNERQSQQMLVKEADKPYTRGCSASVGGYVAGMPNDTKKQKTALVATEKHLREEMHLNIRLNDVNTVKSLFHQLRDVRKKLGIPTNDGFLFRKAMVEHGFSTVQISNILGN